MTNHHVIFDLEHENLAHTRIDCEAHLGLVELVDRELGPGAACADEILELAARHGLVVPAAYADRAKPCPHCTLVAAPLWRAA